MTTMHSMKPLTRDDDVDETEVVAYRGPFQLLKTGIRRTAPVTFEAWEAATLWAQKVEKASPWWVGELIEYGEQAFGEKYSQALDATRYTEQALKDIAYVVRHVQLSRRRDELSFSHHREVASLTPVQVEWLDRADARTAPPSDQSVESRRRGASGRVVHHGVLPLCPRPAAASQSATARRAIRQVHMKGP